MTVIIIIVIVIIIVIIIIVVVVTGGLRGIEVGGVVGEVGLDMEGVVIRVGRADVGSRE